MWWLFIWIVAENLWFPWFPSQIFHFRVLKKNVKRTKRQALLTTSPFFVFLRLIVTYSNHDCGGNMNLMKSVVMISFTDFQIRSSCIGSVYISGNINFLLLCTHTNSVRPLIYLCRYFIALFWQALSQCSCSLMKRISPFGRLPNC